MVKHTSTNICSCVAKISAYVAISGSVEICCWCSMWIALSKRWCRKRGPLSNMTKLEFPIRFTPFRFWSLPREICRPKRFYAYSFPEMTSEYMWWHGICWHSLSHLPPSPPLFSMLVHCFAQNFFLYRIHFFYAKNHHLIRPRYAFKLFLNDFDERSYVVEM